MPGFGEQIRLTIDTIDSERMRIAEFFKTFSEADWEKPTFCPGWNTSQIVGHLTLGAQYYASTVSNGLVGNHGFPLGSNTQEEFMALRSSIMNEIAALDGGALVNKFDKKTQEVISLFRSLGSEDLGKYGWHRRGVIPIPLLCHSANPRVHPPRVGHTKRARCAASSRRARPCGQKPALAISNPLQHPARPETRRPISLRDARHG